VSKRKKPRTDHEKTVLGKQWRSEMDDLCESVPALVRHRVLYLFPALDLADESKATDLQVYELLEDLLHYDPIKREHLEDLIDRRVPQVFGLK
jgi:hypothetical protein